MLSQNPLEKVTLVKNDACEGQRFSIPCVLLNLFKKFFDNAFIQVGMLLQVENMTELIRYAKTGRKRDYGCQDIYIISGFLWDIHRSTQFWHYKPLLGIQIPI